MDKFYTLFQDSWVQTFDDSKQGRQDLCIKSPLREITYEQLKKLNEQGAGIFIQPNPSNGRKEEDLTSIEWLYVDMDEGDKIQMMSIISKSPIKPDIIVESKRSYHLYWKVKCTKEQFKTIIDGLITFYNGDTAISSPNEVLRAPTFFHCKDPDNRFKITVQHLDIQTHTPQDFMREYPTTAQKIVKRFGTENPDDVLRVIKNIDITEILKHCGVDVRRGIIFENGKATSASVWKEGNIVKRFSGKEGGGSTIDIVMHHLGKTTAEAIKFLKDYAGIIDETILEKVTKKKTSDDVFGYTKPYTFGTEKLDKVMTPIQRNHYNLFVGETGHGKTTFGFYMAKKNAELGHKVLFLSLEMTTDAILTRYAREKANITKEMWREKHNLPENIKKSFIEEKKKLENLPNITLAGFPKEIAPTCENIASIIIDGKFDLVFIDNFDLIFSERQEKLEKEEAISKFFMDFTNDKQIPVFMLHHFKKGNDTRSSRGNDSIKGSSKITHSADNIFVGKKNMDSITENDKAEFTITQIKDRDFGIGGLSIVYHNKGDFQDKSPYGIF